MLYTPLVAKLRSRLPLPRLASVLQAARSLSFAGAPCSVRPLHNPSPRTGAVLDGLPCGARTSHFSLAICHRGSLPHCPKGRRGHDDTLREGARRQRGCPCVGMLQFRTKKDEEAALLPAEAPPSLRIEALFFAIAFATIAPAAALLALVAAITDAYSDTAYVYVVGFIFVSALPMTAAQYAADAAFDIQYGLRTASLFRLTTSCIVQGVACILLGASTDWPGSSTLYACSALIGFGAWTANGTLNAIAAQTGGQVSQGLGMQVSFLASFFVIYLGMGSSAFLYGVSFPALGLLCSLVLLSDSDVVVALNVVSHEPRRREEGERPTLENLCGIEFFAMAGSVIALAAMSGYSDLASVLYVSFNSGNVLSRGVVSCFAVPSEYALMVGCALRTLVLPALFFMSDLPEGFDVYIAVGFCIYATVGGVLIQGPLLLVRRLDDAVAAARTVNLAQGAGLAVGGLVCCGVALGYDYS